MEKPWLTAVYVPFIAKIKSAHLRAVCLGCQGKISPIPIAPSIEHRKQNRVKKW
jgi:hypothetical protein